MSGEIARLPHTPDETLQMMPGVEVATPEQWKLFTSDEIPYEDARAVIRQTAVEEGMDELAAKVAEPYLKPDLNEVTVGQISNLAAIKALGRGEEGQKRIKLLEDNFGTFVAEQASATSAADQNTAEAKPDTETEKVTKTTRRQTAAREAAHLLNNFKVLPGLSRKLSDYGTNP